MEKLALTLTLFIPALLIGAGGKHHHHHHQKAHVHGEGSMKLVEDKGVLLIDITIPAHDIVGFEHHPKNDAQRTAVQDAAKKLNDVGSAIQPDPKAKCKPSASAKVESELLKKEDKHHGHHHHHHHHHDHEDSHSEFKLRYQFKCEGKTPSFVKVSLFEHFKGIKAIDGEAVTSNGQKSQELTKKAPNLKL